MQSQLVHGDSYEVLPTLPQGCVDLILVDPPYNIGIDYGGGKQDDLLDEDKYLEQMDRLVCECVRRLTPTGGIWFLCPERWADQMGVGQKVPLNKDRDNVTPAYHRTLCTLVGEAMQNAITEDDANTWGRNALADPKSSEPLRRTLVEKRFGNKPAAYDMSDIEI